MSDPKHFYVGIKAAIVHEGKVLLVRESEEGFWDTPGGRINENESIEEALIRELNEELPSIENPEIGNLIHAFRIPRNIKENVSLVLLFYTVTADFPRGIKLSSEHTNYRWFEINEARKSSLVSDAVRSMLNVL